MTQDLNEPVIHTAKIGAGMIGLQEEAHIQSIKRTTPVWAFSRAAHILRHCQLGPIPPLTSPGSEAMILR